MSHSPFPWSEGESFVLDANGDLICREPNHHESGKNWRDDRALIAAIPQMVAALEASVADLEKVSNWLGRLATASEASARDTRFMSLADANRTDAKNYRATIKSISGSIETARAVLKKVTK